MVLIIIATHIFYYEISRCFYFYLNFLKVVLYPCIVRTSLRPEQNNMAHGILGKQLSIHKSCIHLDNSDISLTLYAKSFFLLVGLKIPTDLPIGEP